MADPKIYDRIGVGYNQTRRADPYICRRVHELLAPTSDGVYADIGCGTGNYTIMLHDLGGNFIGIEPSEIMLDEARDKREDITWLSGSAEHLPLTDNSADGAVATFTIHHWSDIRKSFHEIARVLKPGARLIIFTCTPDQIKGYWLNEFFPEMVKRSLGKAIDPTLFANAAEGAGLQITKREKYFIKEDIRDGFYYSGKHHPEKYLDPAVRKGMSVFATLLDKNEEAAGLDKLKRCIEGGRFDEIKKKYDNDNGDCIFIVLTKQQ